MKSRLKPTDEQSEIVKCLPAAGEIMLINAYAGTGKTSTLRMIAEANPETRILYICYNRSTAEKAAKTFPKNVKCKTIHSLAYGEIGRHYDHKLGSPTARDVMLAFNIEKSYVAVLALKLVEKYCYSTQREISLEILNPEDADDRIVLNGVRKYPESLSLALAVWSAMADISSPFQITHDGYLKIWSFRSPVLPYRLLMLDESQDTNPVTLEIVLAQAKRKKAGLVLVGDTHQAIYQWRKAIDAMAAMQGHASYHFPLTISFRFGQAIADNASKLLGYLGDPIRIIGAGPTENNLPNSVVIGRTNADILITAFEEVLKNKGQVHFAGTTQDRNWDPYYLYEIQILVDLHYLKSGQYDRVETLQIKQFKSYEEVIAQRDGDEVGVGEDEQLSKWVLLLDTLEFLSTDSSGSITSESVLKSVRILRENSTSADDSTLSVSTAHRAKGLEWRSVNVLRGFIEPIPPRYAAELYHEERLGYIKRGTKIPLRYDGGIDPETRAEVNALYVAVTRASHEIEHAWLDEWLAGRSIGQVYDIPPEPKQYNAVNP